jgi:hypothetical protein
MPEPTGGDLHIDALLSNMSVGYMNKRSAYVADRVFPTILTNKQSDVYAIYNKYDWFSDQAKRRAPLTETAGGGYALETPGTFYNNEWGFHKDIADEDADNADEVFQLEQEAVEFCVDKIRIRREVRWAAGYFATGVWTTDLSGMTDTPGANEFRVWDDYTNSTPIADIADAKTLVLGLTGLIPNTLVVSHRVHQSLENHPNILERYKYTQTGILTEELLAKVFGVDNYVIGSALVAAAPEGTNTLSFLLNQYDALLVYAAPGPSRRRPSGGYTFRWKRPRWNGSTGDRLESTVRKFYMKEIRGHRIECSSYEDIKLVAADCGVFFDDAIAAGRTITS